MAAPNSFLLTLRATGLPQEVSGNVGVDIAVPDGLVRQDTDLTILIEPFFYDLGGIKGRFAGVLASAVTNGATNFVFLDSTGALVINTTGYPPNTEVHIRLARVVASGGVITSIIPERALLTGAGASAVMDAKQSCRLATTANVGLAGLAAIDGVVPADGDRVLVKNQAAAQNNGIYIAHAGAWNRSPDADTSDKVTAGMFTFITEGATQADTGWILSTDDPIVLGVTLLTFVQFAGAAMRPDVQENGVDVVVSAAKINARDGIVASLGVPGQANLDADYGGTAATITDSTNSGGAATTLSRSDHAHAHGTRGGGTLHAVATTSTAGFMSSTDKTNLDNLVTVNTVTTVNAVATTTATIPVAANTTVTVEVHSSAKQTSGGQTNAAGYVKRATFHRIGAGALGQIGATQDDFVRETSAGMTTQIVVSGNDILVQVVGIAATTINWRTEHRIVSVS